MTILPFAWHVFQCLKDTVGAGIDGDRGAVTPEDLAPVVEDEQRTLADAVGFPISSVALRDLTLGVVGKGAATSDAGSRVPGVDEAALRTLFLRDYTRIKG